MLSSDLYLGCSQDLFALCRCRQVAFRRVQRNYSLTHARAHTHTHTHTHIYIYIYIYMGMRWNPHYHSGIWSNAVLPHRPLSYRRRVFFFRPLLPALSFFQVNIWRSRNLFLIFCYFLKSRIAYCKSMGFCNITARCKQFSGLGVFLSFRWHARLCLLHHKL